MALDMTKLPKYPFGLTKEEWEAFQARSRERAKAENLPAVHVLMEDEDGELTGMWLDRNGKPTSSGGLDLCLDLFQEQEEDS